MTPRFANPGLEQRGSAGRCEQLANARKLPLSAHMRRTGAAVSGGIALCLLAWASACNEPPRERAADRSPRATRLAAEEAAQKVPAKPTSPVAAPGAAEPPPTAAEVPQRITGQEDLPTPTQLPVAEDFTAETAATIVRGNYHSELNNLESEMKSEH